VTAHVELARVVNNVVAKYAGRCWWADADELRQEAWIAAIESFRGWNPAKGPIGPYAQVAVRRAVAAFLIHETSPVSASWHERHNLIGVERASVEPRAEDKPQANWVDPAPLVAPEETWADELLEDARWRVRILGRLLELLGPSGENDLDLLVGEKKRVGRPPEWFKSLTAEQRELIAKDKTLKDIWEERQP